MEIEELLARAWSAVEKARIPEPLQEYAFKEAITRISAHEGTGAALATPSPPKPQEANAAEDSSAAATTLTDAQLFAKFSKESTVAQGLLEQVFYFEGGIPHLNGPKAKFGSNLADQSRAVALGLTAAYDYALDEQSTPASTIRAECDRLKCDPGTNFAKAMNGLTTVNYVGASKKKTTRVKGEVTSDALKKLVNSVLGVAE
ncbi:hypothetical protein ITJ57_12095 [Plantibacter sp. VKM Ac-2880]|uniref:hypothetical protein n=1 Tax=Plantibacter sp. VKM Ac-2880 TaxID=2783827 RepID=UPI001890AA3B|nr:hypothetical protein [Plantibacter sp. VKM Ac-2880]MBF4569502.1 hypothetical protein [Plantibacter sp. VKM Ac-2880]